MDNKLFLLYDEFAPSHLLGDHNGIVELLDQTIQQFMHDNDKHHSLNIGLFGSWGTGKTSIMRESQKKYKDNAFWFDPWQYQNNDNIIQAFLLSFYNTIKGGEGGAKKELQLYRRLSLMGKEAFHPGYTASLAASAGGVINSNINGATSFFDKFFGLLNHNYKEQLTFSSVKLKERFEELVECYVAEKPLLIFVDNLDRVTPNEAIIFLDAIHQLVNSCKQCHCCVIVGIDRERLKQAVEEKYFSENDCPDYLHYFRKIFQAQIDILPFKLLERRKFILIHLLKLENSGLDENDPYYLKNLANLIRILAMCEDSPRRLILIINQYKVAIEYLIKSGRLSSLMPELCLCLAKMLMIKIAVPEFYERFKSQADVLNILNSWEYSYCGRHSLYGFSDTIHERISAILEIGGNHFSSLNIKQFDEIKEIVFCCIEQLTYERVTYLLRRENGDLMTLLKSGKYQDYKIFLEKSTYFSRHFIKLVYRNFLQELLRTDSPEFLLLKTNFLIDSFRVNLNLNEELSPEEIRAQSVVNDFANGRYVYEIREQAVLNGIVGMNCNKEIQTDVLINGVNMFDPKCISGMIAITLGTHSEYALRQILAWIMNKYYRFVTIFDGDCYGIGSLMNDRFNAPFFARKMYDEKPTITLLAWGLNLHFIGRIIADKIYHKKSDYLFIAWKAQYGRLAFNLTNLVEYMLNVRIYNPFTTLVLNASINILSYLGCYDNEKLLELINTSDIPPQIKAECLILLSQFEDGIKQAIKIIVSEDCIKDWHLPAIDAIFRQHNNQEENGFEIEQIKELLSKLVQEKKEKGKNRKEIFISHLILLRAGLTLKVPLSIEESYEAVDWREQLCCQILSVQSAINAGVKNNLNQLFLLFEILYPLETGILPLNGDKLDLEIIITFEQILFDLFMENSLSAEQKEQYEKILTILAQGGLMDIDELTSPEQLWENYERDDMISCLDVFPRQLIWHQHYRVMRERRQNGNI